MGWECRVGSAMGVNNRVVSVVPAPDSLCSADSTRRVAAAVAVRLCALASFRLHSGTVGARPAARVHPLQNLHPAPPAPYPSAAPSALRPCGKHIRAPQGWAGRLFLTDVPALAQAHRDGLMDLTQYEENDGAACHSPRINPPGQGTTICDGTHTHVCIQNGVPVMVSSPARG